MDGALIISGLDAGIAVAGVWCMAAIGGWYAGAAAYFFSAKGYYVWRRLDAFRKAVFVCVSAMVALFGLLLLPATLPSAHSAWWWHKSRQLRREKQMVLTRGMAHMRERLNRHNKTQEAT